MNRNSKEIVMYVFQRGELNTSTHTSLLRLMCDGELVWNKAGVCREGEGVPAVPPAQPSQGP